MRLEQMHVGDDHREVARRLVHRVGLRPASRLLDVSRETYLRILADLPVTMQVADHVTDRLASEDVLRHTRRTPREAR